MPRADKRCPYCRWAGEVWTASKRCPGCGEMGLELVPAEPCGAVEAAPKFGFASDDIHVCLLTEDHKEHECACGHVWR